MSNCPAQRSEREWKNILLTMFPPPLPRRLAERLEQARLLYCLDDTTCSRKKGGLDLVKDVLHQRE